MMPALGLGDSSLMQQIIKEVRQLFTEGTLHEAAHNEDNQN